MNLLLLEAEEVNAEGRAVLTGRRHQHAVEVLRAAENDVVKVGIRSGLVGTARIVSRTADSLELEVSVHDAPPVRPGIDVLLAVPRPKALKKVIPALASLGIDRVLLINAARVEKSYFDSKVLNRDALQSLIDLGLEQAKDTVAPLLEIRERFKPFIEDELKSWAGAARKLLMHPVADGQWPRVESQERLLLAIGPEGGWVPFEIDLLQAHGFVPVSLGPRTLRVEVAVPAIVGALRPRLGS